MSSGDAKPDWLPDYHQDLLEITAAELWLKDRELREKVQTWVQSMRIPLSQCAEFVITLTEPARVRFTVYDLRDGMPYMSGGRAAAYLETRKLPTLPEWVFEWMASIGRGYSNGLKPPAE